MTASPTLLLPGGSGYLGQVLARDFLDRAWRVVVLTRGGPSPRYGEAATWDGKTLGGWTRHVDEADVVVNLAGRTVNCRYTAKNRRQIYDSRLESTRVLGEAIARSSEPPRLWINSSSATIYRHAEDRPMDEASGELGEGFSVDVCQRWERLLGEAATPRTRKVALRSAMVFGPGRGGVYEAFRRIVRLGLGGTLGPGTQYVSWIHSEDFARAVRWILDHDELAGVVNLASPFPVHNADFMRTFRRACRRPIGLPAAAWMLEIGAFFLRTETELLLKSRRVVPAVLLESGFEFRYPELGPALEQIEGDFER